jgi:hypothetical protein
MRNAAAMQVDAAVVLSFAASSLPRRGMQVVLKASELCAWNHQVEIILG